MSKELINKILEDIGLESLKNIETGQSNKQSTEDDTNPGNDELENVNKKTRR